MKTGTVAILASCLLGQALAAPAGVKDKAETISVKLDGVTQDVSVADLKDALADLGVGKDARSINLGKRQLSPDGILQLLKGLGIDPSMLKGGLGGAASGATEAAGAPAPGAMKRGDDIVKQVLSTLGLTTDDLDKKTLKKVEDKVGSITDTALPPISRVAGLGSLLELLKPLLGQATGALGGAGDAVSGLTGGATSGLLGKRGNKEVDSVFSNLGIKPEDLDKETLKKVEDKVEEINGAGSPVSRVAGLGGLLDLLKPLLGQATGALGGAGDAVSGLTGGATSGLLGKRGNKDVENVLGNLGVSPKDLDKDTLKKVEDKVAEIKDGAASPISRLGGLGGLLGILGPLLGSVTSTAGGLVDSATDVADGATGGLTKPLTNAVDGAVDTAGQVAGQATGAAGLGKRQAGGDILSQLLKGLGLDSTVDSVTSAADGLTGGAASGLADTATGAVDDAAGAVGDAAGQAGDAASGAADAVGDAASGAADAAGLGKRQLGSTVDSLLQSLGLGDAVSSATGAVDGLTGGATGSVTDAAGQAVDGVTGAAGDAVSGLTGKAGLGKRQTGVSALDSLLQTLGLGDAVSSVTDSADQLTGGLTSGVTDAVGDATKGATDAVGGATKGATDAVSGLTGGLGKRQGAAGLDIGALLQALGPVLDQLQGGDVGASPPATGATPGAPAPEAPPAPDAAPTPAATPVAQMKRQDEAAEEAGADSITVIFDDLSEVSSLLEDVSDVVPQEQASALRETIDSFLSSIAGLVPADAGEASDANGQVF